MARNTADIESTTTQPTTVENPYSRGPPTTNEKIFNKVYRSSILGFSLYILHTWEVYATVLTSPKVLHEWFKVGLAASIAMLFLKSYVELYCGKLQHQTVDYKHFRQSTHVMMGLLCLTTISFYMALWPAYGWNTIIIMSLVGFGILLQFCLLVPTYIQNMIGFVALTFFLQEYA